MADNFVLEHRSCTGRTKGSDAIICRPNSIDRPLNRFTICHFLFPLELVLASAPALPFALALSPCAPNAWRRQFCCSLLHHLIPSGSVGGTTKTAAVHSDSIDRKRHIMVYHSSLFALLARRAPVERERYRGKPKTSSFRPNSHDLRLTTAE